MLNHIQNKNYYDFGSAKTPERTISAQLGDFIREGDTRVKRIKNPDHRSYSYYLTKNEQNIGNEILDAQTETKHGKTNTVDNQKTNSYDEKDLHLLLSSYLKNTNTYSKTISHTKSTVKVTNQIWIHPDMIGIKFLDLKNRNCKNFLKSINQADTFKLSSYELKKEINTDNELKQAFFQAVSNSSWANYGYLVAFEFSDSLEEEMDRLNQSFGIGIIELNANPYKSKVLYPSVYRDWDIKTIDKLCELIKDFEKFIEKIMALMTASDAHISGSQTELESFCDKYLANDTEFEKYCKEKKIG